MGFRPVPKKRTFLSRRTSSQSENITNGSDTQVQSAGIVPAPRRSLQRGSSGSSNQSYPKGQDETPQKSVISKQVSQSAQPTKSVEENSQQPFCDVSQVSSNSSLERERNPLSLTRDRSVDSSSHPELSHPFAATHSPYNLRPAAYAKSDVSTDRASQLKRDERDGEPAVNILHTGSIQDSDRENSSSVGTAMRQEDLSLPQSTVGEFSDKK